MPIDYPVESYIVRIYQREGLKPVRILGIIESADGRVQFTFKSSGQRFIYSR